jgi:hypothetical protein
LQIISGKGYKICSVVNCSARDAKKREEISVATRKSTTGENIIFDDDDDSEFKLAFTYFVQFLKSTLLLPTEKGYKQTITFLWCNVCNIILILKYYYVHCRDSSRKIQGSG